MREGCTLLMDPSKREEVAVIFWPHLFCLGYPRQSSPQNTLVTYFLAKFNQPFARGSRTRGARQLGWANCLALPGRVTLAGGTAFLHINTLLV